MYKKFTRFSISLLMLFLLVAHSNAQKIWGYTANGGAKSNGVVHKTDVSTNNYTDIHDFDNSLQEGFQPLGALCQAADGNFYGVTQVGGTNNLGTLVKIDGNTHSFTKLKDFDASTGQNPLFQLIEVGGKLYGGNYTGGANGGGTIYSYDYNTNTFTVLYSLTAATEGNGVKNLFVHISGILYGVCQEAGANNAGTIFKYDIAANSFSKIHDFDNTNGSNPQGLCLATNNKLYGTTGAGGASNNGVIYELDPSSNNFTKKYDFSGASDGVAPLGELCLGSNNKLYGVCASGGANNAGTIVEFDPGSSNFAKVYDFDQSNSKPWNPTGGLLNASDGFLYGQCYYGGANNQGTLYKFDIASHNFTTVHDFAGPEGGHPYANKLIEENSGSAGSGGSGGLESKSLGDVIAKRLLNKAMHNELVTPSYATMQSPVTVTPTINMGTGASTTLQLSDILPKQLYSNNVKFVSYITTPTDITSITNATDVLSIDYTYNSQAKAVSFATKTNGAVYEHTKVICDRLKGSTLINVSNTSISGVNMVTYTLKKVDGTIEYAMSFVVGAKTGRNNYTIQSTWLNQDYTTDETMYNIQLWGVSPNIVADMANAIITNFKNNLPLQNIAGKSLPQTYITSGLRVNTNLNLSISNFQSNTSGYFVVEDRTNELANTVSPRTIPFSVPANGKTTVTIPVMDNYDASISMYINNQLQDVVYMADGAWSYSAGSNSIVTSFIVTNDNSRNYMPDELPVLRNVEVKGNISDYVSVIKLLKGGGLTEDLSAMKTLKFTASGGNSLQIVLVKNSIANWTDQYSITIPLDNNQKDYFISLDAFTSASLKDKINANDVSAIVFGIVSGKGSTAFSTTLSNLSFRKQESNLLQSFYAKEVQLYPNPANKRFNASFFSEKDNQPLTLRIIEAATGKVVATKSVTAVKGENNVSVDLMNSSSNNIYIISLDGDGIQYKKAKILSRN